MIWELRHEFKVSLLLDVAKLARSTYYYHTKRRQEPDKYSKIKEQITNIFHENRSRYGYRRITMEMKNRGCCINHKTVGAASYEGTEAGMQGQDEEISFLQR